MVFGVINGGIEKIREARDDTCNLVPGGKKVQQVVLLFGLLCVKLFVLACSPVSSSAGLL